MTLIQNVELMCSHIVERIVTEEVRDDFPRFESQQARRQTHASDVRFCC